jgi:hypothetical protein
MAHQKSRLRGAAALCLALATATPAFPDPKADAQLVAESIATRPIFEAAIQANRRALIDATTADLERKGIKMTNPDRFFDILMEEFIDEFTANMQRDTADLFLSLFNEEELSDLAAFYASPTGRTLSSKLPDITGASARLGRIAGMEAGQNANLRVAKRLEAEGISIDNDKSLTKRLIDALKN